MIVSKKHYDYLRNKFDLLTNELVKANSELSNNINFASYMKPQDVQDILWGEAEKIQYEDIVKALVKTIKFYEQADHKLYDAVTQKVEDARQELATNNTFKAWLDFYLNDHYININEATTLALPKAIYQLEQIVRDYKNEIKKQDEGLEKAEKVIKELKEELEDQKLFTTDANNQCTRMSKYIVDLERENKELKNELEENEEKLKNVIKENKDFKHANLDLTEELSKQYQINDNDQAEIRDISDLFNEQVDTIIKRDNEITALKHMLDRKDND